MDGDVQNYLNSIIDCEDEAKQLKDALNEALTGVSQDAFYNEFINNLSNMETSFEDMCDNFEDYLRKSIIAALIAANYKDEIDALYQEWVDAASDGNIDKSESERLRKKNEDLTKRMLDDREKWMSDLGFDNTPSSQSSSRGGFETITQDQASALEGRFTGMHETMLAIKEDTSSIAAWNQPIGEKFNIDGIAVPILALNESALRIERMIEENRSIAINSYYELKDINKNTKELYQMNERLGNIEKNTKGFAAKK